MSQRSRSNLITKIYLDQSDPAGFGSPQKVWRRVRNHYPNVTLKEVKRVLAGIDAYTLNRQKKRPLKTRRYTSPGINHHFQMDLFVLNRSLAQINRAGFILFCVDVFSRKLFARELRTKHGETVATAICSIIKANNSVPPVTVLTDRGSEFLSSPVQDLFRRYRIRHLTSENVYHAAIVERTIRTLREKFGRYRTHHKTDVFVPQLQQFVSAFNRSPHSALPSGMCPNDVTPKTELRVWKHQFARHFRRAPGFYGKGDLRVGDVVRITKFLGVFAKSSDETFTREKFVITHVIETKPFTYKIASLRDSEAIIGSFYRSELQPVNT